MFRKKEPSEVNTAKENEIKLGITTALSQALKTLQKHNVGTNDQTVYSTEIATAVCNALEAVFLHGLKANRVKKLANYMGFGQQSENFESLNFWQFALNFTHSDVISQLKHLGHITTEIGLCRAWIRVALNDCLMESYIDAMVADKKSLEYYYTRTSYLRDIEHPGILKSYLQGLMAFQFKLSYNASVLNSWGYAPLTMCGLVDPEGTPLPVVKQPLGLRQPSEAEPQTYTSVEVEQVKKRSRSKNDDRGQKTKPSSSPRDQENPMECPRLGPTPNTSYIVSNSDFTTRDVEEFKKLALSASPMAGSECSSSSHISCPDPSHLNVSPSDYVAAAGSDGNHGNQSTVSGGSKSEEMSRGKRGKRSGKTNLKSSKTGAKQIKASTAAYFEASDSPEQGEGSVSSVEKDNASLIKEAEDLLKQVYRESGQEYAAGGYEDDGGDTGGGRDYQYNLPDSASGGFETFLGNGVPRQDEVSVYDVATTDNADVGEVTLVNDATDLQQSSSTTLTESASQEKTDSVTQTDKPSNTVKGYPREATSAQSGMTRETTQAVPVKDTGLEKGKKSKLTVENLQQFSTDLENKMSAMKSGESSNKSKSEISSSSQGKRKRDKVKGRKEKLKPEFGSPRAEVLQPELSDAVADSVDTMQSNSQTQHRLSLPSIQLPSRLTKPRQSLPDVLEQPDPTDHPDEVLRDIYDGKPLPTEGLGTSLGNSLVSGRGWSSSFDSEMEDSLEPMSPPRAVQGVPITRPKAESFGTLLQNYTPSSSLSAPSIDDVLHNFPRTESVLSPREEPTVPAEDFPDAVGDEFEIVTSLDTPDPNQIVRMSQLDVIANEQGLDAQNFQCRGCKRPVGLIYGKPRVCTFDGGYYCYECHENDEYYIPALIVHNWDFRKQKVAKKNLEFLQEVEEQPHINVAQTNARLFDHVPEIQEIRNLRNQLVYLKTYLFTCKQSIADDLRRLVWPRDYLYDSADLFSLADLLQVPTGALASSLKKVIKFAIKHVYGCRLCSQKGFICELCNNPKVIYAFEVEDTVRCPQCKSVFHKDCKTDNKPCPKCERREMRESKHGLLETDSHDYASHAT